MLYTSGTSGAPKGVMLTHANMMFTATSAARMRGMTRDDISYGVLPMAHIVGLTAQFMGNLSAGSSLVLAPRFTPAETARMLREEGVTIFTGVPAMMAKMLDWSRETGTPLTAPRLRLMTVAGSPMTPALKHDAEQAFGLPLDNGYGLTECAPTIAQTRVGERRSDCAVGHPIPGVEVRIVAAGGAAVPQGDIGELWVRTPGLMKGYYRSPDLTAQVIDAEGWFNTGDMVRMEPDGALTIVGRSKELIIRSGLNVYPVEVEQALNAHPEVIQSAVVGRTVRAQRGGGRLRRARRRLGAGRRHLARAPARQPGALQDPERDPIHVAAAGRAHRQAAEGRDEDDGATTGRREPRAGHTLKEHNHG